MARKDVSDKLVCVAHAYRILLYQQGNPHPPWPYELLSIWTGQSEKVCWSAMVRADKHGLLQVGVSLRTAWLTDKGKELLGDTDILTTVRQLGAEATARSYEDKIDYRGCHERWLRAGYHPVPQDHPDGMPIECMSCAFYIPLQGRLGMDWGVCTNAVSPYEGTITFEHSGCAHYTAVV